MILPPQSEKILRLALNSAASEGEWQAAAVKFISALRGNGTSAEEVIAAATPKAPAWTSLYRMPFGQYKGMAVSDIPSDYLQWIISKVTNNASLVNAAKAEMAGRDE